MNARDTALPVAREWIAKAENDLKAAACALPLADECPTDVVCFHAQQCVEKYLKAALVLHGIGFPKTHDIRMLMGLLPQHIRPDVKPAMQDRLTEYATVTRYPGDYEPILFPEARKAVALARRVRSHVRRALPRAATRRCRRGPCQRT